MSRGMDRLKARGVNYTNKLFYDNEVKFRSRIYRLPDNQHFYVVEVLSFEVLDTLQEMKVLP